ncbi:MAG: YHS domain-containing protein [Sedimentibacter sp.]
MEFLLQNGLYILLLGFMGFMMFKGGGCCGGHSHGGHNNENHDHSGHKGNDMQNGNQIQMAVDPVCGMYVNPETSIKQNVNGITYYFCSESCRRSFLENQKA